MEPEEFLDRAFFEEPRTVEEICAVTGLPLFLICSAVARSYHHGILYRHPSPVTRFGIYPPSAKREVIQSISCAVPEPKRPAVKPVSQTAEAAAVPNLSRQSLTIHEATGYYGVTREKIDRWIAEGRLENFKTGGGQTKLYLDSFIRCVREQYAAEKEKAHV